MLGLFGSMKKRARPLAVHADDDPTILVLIAEVLESLGVDVVSADSGSEGLALVQKHVPDLVILDVRMPHMDGYQVCRAVKADAKLANIPVLMVTAMGQTKDAERAISEGANAFVPKPLNIPQFKAKVSGLIGLSGAQA